MIEINPESSTNMTELPWNNVTALEQKGRTESLETAV